MANPLHPQLAVLPTFIMVRGSRQLASALCLTLGVAFALRPAFSTAADEPKARPQLNAAAKTGKHNDVQTTSRAIVAVPPELTPESDLRKEAKDLLNEAKLVSLDETSAELLYREKEITLRMGKQTAIAWEGKANTVTLKYVDLDNYSICFSIGGQMLSMEMDFDTPEPSAAVISPQPDVRSLDDYLAGLDQEEQAIPPSLDVTIINETVSSIGTRHVFFKVKNSTRRICKYASFKIFWTDADGAILDSSISNVADLAPGGERTLEAMGSMKAAPKEYRIEPSSCRWDEHESDAADTTSIQSAESSATPEPKLTRKPLVDKEAEDKAPKEERARRSRKRGAGEKLKVVYSSEFVGYDGDRKIYMQVTNISDKFCHDAWLTITWYYKSGRVLALTQSQVRNLPPGDTQSIIISANLGGTPEGYSVEFNNAVFR